MEYLRNFKNVADANKVAAKGLLSPNTTTFDNIKTVDFITASTKKFTCTFDASGNVKDVKPYVDLGHILGEIAYWDGTKVSYVNYTEWDSSLGTALAVCVVPTIHAKAWGNGKARFMSIKGITSAGTESNEDGKMQWRPAGSAQDTPLENYNYIPLWDNVIGGTISANTVGCIASDYINGKTANTIDTKAQYCLNTYGFVPSPYAADETFYEDYKRTITGGNALSDFNGKTNTEILVGIDSNFIAANACHNYATNGIADGEWYLPAAGEMSYVISRLKVIQSALTVVGGTLIEVTPEFGTMQGNYWTSTEHNTTEAFRVFMKSTYLNIAANNNKNYAYSARPFVELQ